MTLKRKSSGTFTDISATLKRRASGAWVDVQTISRRASGVWVVVWQRITLAAASATDTTSGVPATAGIRLTSAGLE